MLLSIHRQAHADASFHIGLRVDVLVLARGEGVLGRSDELPTAPFNSGGATFLVGEKAGDGSLSRLLGSVRVIAGTSPAIIESHFSHIVYISFAPPSEWSTRPPYQMRYALFLSEVFPAYFLQFSGREERWNRAYGRDMKDDNNIRRTKDTVCSASKAWQ